MTNTMIADGSNPSTLRTAISTLRSRVATLMLLDRTITMSMTRMLTTSSMIERIAWPRLTKRATPADSVSTFNSGWRLLELFLDLAGDALGGVGVAQTQPDAVDRLFVAGAFLVIILAEEEIARVFAGRHHADDLETQIFAEMAGTKDGELLADLPAHLLHDIGAEDRSGLLAFQCLDGGADRVCPGRCACR